MEGGAPPAARLAAWIDEHRRVLWALVALCVVAFAGLWVAVKLASPLPGDRNAIGLRQFTTHVPGPIYHVGDIAQHAADPVVALLTVAGVAVAVAASMGRRWAAVVIAAASVVLASASLKTALGPPPLASLLRFSSTASFPSGHTAYATSLFGLVALLQLARGRRAVAALALLVIVVMGPARVAVGAHWPSDVIAGYVLGVAWLAVVLLAGARWAARGPAPSAAPAAR